MNGRLVFSGSWLSYGCKAMIVVVDIVIVVGILMLAAIVWWILLVVSVALTKGNFSEVAIDEGDELGKVIDGRKPALRPDGKFS